jgi:hypothetical protein
MKGSKGRDGSKGSAGEKIAILRMFSFISFTLLFYIIAFANLLAR